MKKAKLLSKIFAVLAVVFVGLALAFVKWKKNSANATPGEIKVYIILFALIALATLCLLIAGCKYKYLLLIPAITLTYVNVLFQGSMNAAMGLDGNVTVTDIIAPTSKTVIALLLFAFFITSFVLTLNKKFKWTAIVVISYFAIQLVGILYYLPSIAFESDAKVYTFTAICIAFTYISFITYFAKNFFKCECCCDKKECAPVAESTTEETSTTEEVKAEEAKVEETKAEEVQEAQEEKESE